MEYQQFLKNKLVTLPPTGIQEIPPLSDKLFSFQKDLVTWACRRGRSALFAGTGLGKTFMQLSWANALWEAEKKRVLILTPLAVASQTKEEAAHWGFDAAHVANDNDSNVPIHITNYQKLSHFDLSKYGGIVLDESSILKNESGHYRTSLIEKCATIPYRLACTATPAPNDYMELGNHAQFCGIMSYTDMLSTFFVHDAAKTQDWRLKGHAEDDFWKWMASWSCMLSHPRDIGYDEEGYDLPPLHQFEHLVKTPYGANIETGNLIPMEAQTLQERIRARRATVPDRVQYAASLVNDSKECWVVWCNLNAESDALEKAIPDAVAVKGSMSDEQKIKILRDFQQGNIRVLITKGSITGSGMNWQHCHNTCFVGLNDSFEQIYQATRRFWRYGQKNEVHSHFITADLEGAVLANIRRKEEQAAHMMEKMIQHMADICAINIRGAVRETATYIPNRSMELPQWI